VATKVETHGEDFCTSLVCVCVVLWLCVLESVDRDFEEERELLDAVPTVTVRIRITLVNLNSDNPVPAHS
jgi:hypothetical protein